MKHISLIILLFLSACVSNTFENNFISRAPAHMFKQANVTVDSEAPMLVETDNIYEELNDLVEQDYLILGFNGFEDRMRSSEPAIEFGEKIGATHILYSRESLGKKYANLNAATGGNSLSATYFEKLPDYHPERRKYQKESRYRYTVYYLREDPT